MTLIVPQAGQIELLTRALTTDLVLRLFSNDRIPALTDLIGNYTEVSGGGYASKTLNLAGWQLTPGNPSIALYTTFQDFAFTSTTTAPGTVYGYYLTTVNNLTLVWAERFVGVTLPFTPVNTSLIRIQPRIALQNI